MDELIDRNIGRYHIIQQLGEGGMGTVYKAYDTRLERDVAIKFIRTGAFPPDQLARILARFEREAKALARLSHPNIVGIIDYGDFENAPYLVMEFLPGGTLKQRLGIPMPCREALEILLPIGRSLDFAHKQGIIHRDVKPSNILITLSGEPMLTDFGTAKLLEDTSGQELTATGVGIGTPEYMAPEQWAGQASAQSDIYSLAIVLYELVSGRKPYLAETPAAVLLKQVSDPLPRPTLFQDSIPEAVERVLFKALAKDPKERYADMDAFVQAMAQVLAYLPQNAPADGATVDGLIPPFPAAESVPASPAVLSPSLRKRRLWLWIAGAVVLLPILACLFMWVAGICPPEGPWPQPPWCEGSPYVFTSATNDEPAATEQSLPAVSVTDAPTATAQPIPALPTPDFNPFAMLLFEDDFEGVLLPNWQSSCDLNSTPWILDQIDGRTVYHSQPPCPPGDISCAQIHDTDWQDYTIESSFKFLKPDQFGTHYFSLYGRLTFCPPNVQSIQAYGINVIETGIQLSKYTCVPPANDVVTEVFHYIDPNTWHVLQLIFHSDQIQVWLDGEILLIYVDPQSPILTGGDLWYSTFGSAEILLDDLKVYSHSP